MMFWFRPAAEPLIKDQRDFFGGIIMRETRVTLPELALIAGTRAALGAGFGLLLADRLPEGQRRAVGWTLLLFGALSTIPLAFEVFGGSRLAAHEPGPEQAANGLWPGPTDRFSQRSAPAPT
jgi:hypothetical protein